MPIDIEKAENVDFRAFAQPKYFQKNFAVWVKRITDTLDKK